VLDDRTVSDLICRTYDAALGDEDWTLLIERLMRAVGGKAALLRWRGRPAMPALTINMDLAVQQVYDAYYCRLDPFWPQIRRLPPGSAVDDCALMSAQALERTEFYQGFMVPNGLGAGLSWYGLDPGGQPVALYIVSPSRQPSGTGEALRLLSVLAPHLSRAVTIEGRLAAARLRTASSDSAPRPPALSPRERDCLARVARGVSSKGIARQLALSVDTINEYIGSAMRKLQASSRTEAVATALFLGLLNL
jgi:DNA-binding CsgD family transcriptional regulator